MGLSLVRFLGLEVSSDEERVRIFLIVRGTLRMLLKNEFMDEVDDADEGDGKGVDTNGLPKLKSFCFKGLAGAMVIGPSAELNDI